MVTERNDQPIPTRQSLLSRLRDWNDDPSWQDFFNTYWKLIYNTALKAGLRSVDADEVAQETLISISKAIRSFQYDPRQGSFKGWLHTTTTWRIHDRLRRQEREQIASLEDEGWPEFPTHMDPREYPIAQEWELAWEQNLAEAALDRVKKKVAPKQFQIFDLVVMKQWPTEKVAKALNVSAGYVYLIKHRVAARVKAELKKLRRDPANALAMRA
jgi:RNA polymerase sigma factor (sigma-70 family)